MVRVPYSTVELLVERVSDRARTFRVDPSGDRFYHPRIHCSVSNSERRDLSYLKKLGILGEGRKIRSNLDSFDMGDLYQHTKTVYRVNYNRLEECKKKLGEIAKENSVEQKSPQRGKKFRIWYSKTSDIQVELERLK